MFSAGVLEWCRAGPVETATGVKVVALFTKGAVDGLALLRTVFPGAIAKAPIGSMKRASNLTTVLNCTSRAPHCVTEN